ncbi:HAD family phosphatase [Candidatus Saccharibacteria bacterium]|nr:HAD family phosphatase [Candidatus Saccharibacteria bacterium]
MSKIKLILSDIDGTLVPLLGSNPSKKVIDITKQVQKLGVEIAPVTGRPYDMAKDLFEHIGFHDLGVFDAGASVRRVDTGEVVWKKWLSVERIKNILEILLPVSKTIDYFPDFNEIEATNAVIDEVVEDAPYIFAFVFDTEEGNRAMEKLKEDATLSINVHYAHDKWAGFLNVQITDHLADKYHGVTALRDITSHKQEETLAIGDSGNDIPMFKVAGMKIAMGNATDELKSLADFVVADVDHDGFVEAMERFVLSD